MSTTNLGLPPRRHRGEHPFWHRPAPAVAAVRLDPGFASLRSQLPDKWQCLVRLKYVLDALTVLARTPGWSASSAEGGGRPLLDAIARHLDELASDRGRGMLARQAAATAEAVRFYTRTGRWSAVDLEAPRPGELWMHCGPLRPWGVQESPLPLALLVGRPDPVAQQPLDRVSRHTAALRERVGWVLGATVPPMPHRPGMVALDLLLAGGTSDAGHKNFAHFFPLEAPTGRAPRGDFTVVFANVHLERLTRCSLRLLEAMSGRPTATDPGDVARASLTWFRGHDLAHFWLPVQKAPPPRIVAPPPTAAPALAPFEAMVLEEALADTLGLLSVADIEDPGALGAAFSAEMLRYLSRNHHEFADTTAAALEVGWLVAESDLEWAEPQRWLEAALPPFGRLARDLRAALDGSAEPIGRLRRALDIGRRLVARWYGPLAELPTDLEYSFG